MKINHLNRLWISMVMLLTVVFLAGCIDLALNPAQVRKYHSHQKLGQEQSLRVKVDASLGLFSLECGGDELLYSVDMSWDAANQEKSVTFDPGEDARLSIKVKGRSRSDDLRTSLLLSDRVSLDLLLNTGVGESNVDLTDLSVSSLNLNHGVGKLVLHVDETQAETCDRFEINCGVGEMRLNGLANLAPSRFDFNGGVGKATLDFTGSNNRDMDANIEVGIGGIDIILSEDLGVRMRHRGGLTSGMSLPSGKFHKSGRYYISENFDNAKQRLELEIKTGIGGVNIRFR